MVLVTPVGPQTDTQTDRDGRSQYGAAGAARRRRSAGLERSADGWMSETDR